MFGGDGGEHNHNNSTMETKYQREQKVKELNDNQLAAT